MNPQHLSCDILIVGSGPAGLAAARAASRSELCIILLDDNPRPGGQIWRNGPGVTLPGSAREALQVLQHSRLRYLPGTRVVAGAGANVLLLEDAEQALLVRYQSLILCCGARELLLPFPGWTLPGVTGAGALQALLKNGLAVAGERVVIAGSGPLLLASAATARQVGARVEAVLEQAPLPMLATFTAGLWRWPAKLGQAVGLATTSYRCNAHVLEALGDDRLEAVRIRQGEQVREIPCERLACGFGLVPNTTLASHLGCQLQANAIAVDRYQGTSLPQVYAAGECTGVGGSELARVEGEIAGLAASGQTREATALIQRRAHWQAFAERVSETFALQPALLRLARADTLLCRCEDVPYAAVAGETGWSEAKLHSRCGMGACQGRVCATAAQALFGWTAPTPRAPLVPARIETLLMESSTPSAK
ncbi:Putative oxidoreductase [Pseudomonas chlororaphis subsp. aurantiaca]|uniref:NAD(P)/FAD-dependent oxidoreductase n=1 Tax=Pseudomonas chlororaphis TaxID=587753 RepID=UPI000F58BE1A|nr:FAD/NAD(P)-binding oxidoreductase [Pseudomonas chlororaphis]AZD20724.1 Putative oxidoreductase [Pseudomonas chlororaphis subsp. aurantiaca]